MQYQLNIFKKSVDLIHPITGKKKEISYDHIDKYTNAFGRIQHFLRASLVAQMVKNLSAMQETLVRSLGFEDSLEEGMATHSSILAWRIPLDKGTTATVHGVTKSWT